MHVGFETFEFHSDGSFRPARYEFCGSPEDGWTVTRDSAHAIRLGPGYRLLRTERCGVCSTDLARAHLPFPLPQITGHELIATDRSGQRYVVEINASHRARGQTADCPFCSRGLDTHCPERLVLGIHDLPGGFGPWVLAPVEATIPVPDALPDSTAVLVEPFAAALHAVETVTPRHGDTIAVLGPRRLGMLVVAALAAWRERTGTAFEVLALSRHDGLLGLARELGADRVRAVEGDGLELPDGLADVVVDTTGNPDALPLALRLATREVHLKSTHGRPAAGLAHPTELVVDEIWIDRLPADAGELAALAAGDSTIAWLSQAPVPDTWGGVTVHRGRSAADVLAEIEAGTTELSRADLAVVDTVAQCDAVIRPRPDREVALVRPRGGILLTAGADDDSALATAVHSGVRLTSSRCGDFRRALDALKHSAVLRTLGDRFVTHELPADRIAEMFSIAHSPECIKAVVEHAGAAWPTETANG